MVAFPHPSFSASAPMCCVAATRCTLKGDVVMICATVWITLVGVIRDAHSQRSRFVKQTDHAYIFHCVEGKDKRKPFDWVLPKQIRVLGRTGTILSS